MAVKTIGTNGTTTLNAIQVPSAYAALAISAADIATMRNNIFDDIIGVDGNRNTPPGAQAIAQRIWPGAIDDALASGVLWIPNRGFLRLFPGDWIAVDPLTGWPILLSANTVPGTQTATGTTTSGAFTVTFATSVLLLGWTVGMRFAETNVPANSFISAISQNGLTVTFNNPTASSATGSAANTATVSNWTHS